MNGLTSIANIPASYNLFDPIGDGFVDPMTIIQRITDYIIPFLDYAEPIKITYDTLISSIYICKKGVAAYFSTNLEEQFINTYEAICQLIHAISLIFAFRVGLAISIFAEGCKDTAILVDLTVKNNFVKVPIKLFEVGRSIFSLALLIFPSIPLFVSTLAYRLSCSAFISYNHIFDHEMSNTITSIALYYIIAALSLPVLLAQRIIFPQLIKN